MFTDPLTELETRFHEAMVRAFGDELPDNATAAIAPSRNPKFGDFQANAAMALGKRLGKPPRDVATAIVDALEVDDIVDPPEIAGPGFINLRLKSAALHTSLDSLDGDALGIEAPERRETVVVDLCGVNLAKQMHVGHIRASVIGDALARLYERLGHEVKRQNHFGDWGLPIGMVTHAVRRLSEAGQVDIPSLSLADLEAIYRDAQLTCAADHKGLAAVRRFGLGPKAEAELEEQVEGASAALAEAKAALVALQSGDEGFVSVWRQIADITLAACFENCRRLQVTVTEEHTAGESTYREELAEVVRDLESRGIAEESDGALIVRLDAYGIKEPLLLRKSDGGFLYATTDVAAVRRRVQDMGGDRLVYAVDARQSLHFSQVFAASRKAGYTKHQDGSEAELFHAHFGTILGSDNKPFKTRSGDNVKLSDLLDEAIRRAELAVGEKNPSLAPDERQRVAEAVGIGAIKYADLSSDRIKDYVFDYDRVIAFEGNTGPYLQYALVRVLSIFRKAEDEFGITMESIADRGAFNIEAPEEKVMALQLLKYPGVIRSAAAAYEPHRLCGYLYELASAFSSFFDACPVLRASSEAERDARLRLCGLTGRVLRDGLSVLGIEPLERM